MRQNDAAAKVKTKRYLLGPVEKVPFPFCPKARRSACQFSAKLTITELMMSLPLGRRKMRHSAHNMATGRPQDVDAVLSAKVEFVQ